jgi:hypothetical protein
MRISSINQALPTIGGFTTGSIMGKELLLVLAHKPILARYNENCFIDPPHVQ